MSAGVGERVGLRLFLEGIEIDVVGATVTVGVNRPSEATIEVPNLDSLFQLAPRTTVHLFYEDYEAGAYGGGAPWRLLFAGQLASISESQSGSGQRSASLFCLDFWNLLDTQYLFSLTYSDGGGPATVISNRSAFYASFSSPFGDTVNSPAEVIQAIYASRKTPGYPHLSPPQGPLAGLLSIIEVAVGIQGHYRGVNDWSTVTERVVRLLDQIGSDTGVAAANLFQSTGFQDWLTGRLANLGSVVSLGSVLDLILSYTYTQHLSCPCAPYIPGVRTPPAVAPLPPLRTPSPAASAPPSAVAAYVPPTGGGTSKGIEKSPLDTRGMNPVFLAWLDVLIDQMNAQGVRGMKLVNGIREYDSAAGTISAKRTPNSSPHVFGVAADITAVGGTGFDARTTYGPASGVRRPGWGENKSPGPYPLALWAMKCYPGQPLLSLIGKPLYGTIEKFTGHSGQSFVGPASFTGPCDGKYAFTQKHYDILDANAKGYQQIGEALRLRPDLAAVFRWGGAADFTVYGSRDSDPVWSTYGIQGSDPVHVQFHRKNADTIVVEDRYKVPPYPSATQRPVEVSAFPLPATTPSSAVAPAPAIPDATPATPATPAASAGTRERLLAHLLLPDIWFCPPPLCNIVFPSEVTGLNFQRDTLREVTRLELEARNGILEGASSAVPIHGVYFAPQLRNMRTPDGQPVESLTEVGFQSAALGRTGTPIIMHHERHSGIIPRQEAIEDLTFFAQTDISKIPADDEVGNATAYGETAGKIAEWNFLRQRYAARSASVNGRFMPRLVCGLPAVVVRRPAHTETDHPFHHLGRIESMTHTIHQGSASTSFSLGFVRSHKLQTENDDLFLEGTALASQLANGGKATTTLEVGSKALTADGRRFLRWVRETFYSGYAPTQMPIASAGTVATPTGSDNPEAPRGDAPYVPQVPSGAKGPMGLPIQSITIYPVETAVMESSVAYKFLYTPASLPAPEQMVPGTVYTLLLPPTATNPQGTKVGVVALAAEEEGETEQGGTAPSGATTFAQMKGERAVDADAFPFARVVIEELTGGARQPVEEAIRPPWLGDEYLNANIGPSVYTPLLGCKSVIDFVEGQPLPADLTGHCVEEAVDSIVREYSRVSGGGFAAPAWVYRLTQRSVATLGEVLGTKDAPGFHTYAVGDWRKLEHLDLAEPLKNPWTGETMQEKVPPSMDVRGDRRRRVLRYAGELLANRAIRG